MNVIRPYTHQLLERSGHTSKALQRPLCILSDILWCAVIRATWFARDPDLGGEENLISLARPLEPVCKLRISELRELLDSR